MRRSVEPCAGKAVDVLAVAVTAIVIVLACALNGIGAVTYVLL